MPSETIGAVPRAPSSEGGEPHALVSAAGGTGAEDLASGWLMTHSVQPFAVIAPEGRIITANRAFEKLLGYTAEELGALSMWDLTPPRWASLTHEMIDRVWTTGTPRRFEKGYYRKDGQEIATEVLLEVFRGPNGEPAGFAVFLTDISERKRGEATLRDSAERYQRLYDDAPFGYHEIDLNGVILTANRAECEMIGRKRDEIIGHSVFEFVPEAIREQMKDALRARFEGRLPPGPTEWSLPLPDGRERIIAIENQMVYDLAGRPIGARGTAQDVTWRKQAEAALIASERRARALFEGIEDAVLLHDLEGRILDANPAACRRLGYTREEVLRLRTRDIDDPTFAAGFGDRLELQMRHGKLRIEGRHRTKSGRIIPVDINTSIIQLEDQPAVLAVIRDISERKSLEETRRQFAEAQLKSAWEIEAKNRQLSQSEARYRQLTEGCLDAIVVADHTGLVTLFNTAAENAFGYDSSEVLGHPLTELVPPEHREQLAGALSDYIQTGSSRLVGRTAELRGRRKNGDVFPMEISLSAIETTGEVQFMSAIRDLTERQRMRAMLMQSEKLASIGLLSAGVAHEINNPLAYIANNLAVLERDLKGVSELLTLYESGASHLPADLVARVESLREELDWDYVRDNLARLLSRTRDGVQRVANIVQNLRSLARTSPPKLEPALLSDLIDGALDMVQGRVRRHHIDIQVEKNTTVKILCVPSQIGQVILNMLVNAIQAVESVNRPTGNVIRITTRQQPDAQVIELTDNGCGIPPEAIPQLFDPFYTTKPVGEGTGLGLSISHNIVTGHGGHIDVESEVGKGASFRVVLPWKPV